MVSAAMLVTGCSFTSRAGGDGGNGHDGQVPIDVPAGDGRPTIDGAPDAFATPACGVPDQTGLVLCLELDDPGLTAATDSSAQHHDATVTGPMVATRDVPVISQAAQITVPTVIQTGDSNDFDTQTFTMMAWVRREGMPPMPNQWLTLIDVGGQYEMSYDTNAALVCFVTQGGGTLGHVGDTVSAGEWDLVACTYDGDTACDYVFRNGSATTAPSCLALGKTANTTPTLGVSIGSEVQSNGTHNSHMIGRIDSARIFTRVLSEQEICMAGGLTGC